MNRDKKQRHFSSVPYFAGAALALLLAAFFAAAQGPEHLVYTIDQDCTAFDFAPDGRVVFAVHRVMRTKRYELQRDDIWVSSAKGKTKRIVDGERLVSSPTPFSYAIKSLAWSPDGRRFTVEMAATEMDPEKNTTRDFDLVDLMNEEGKEIKIAGLKDSAIPDASQAAWLADGETVVYLTEAVTPKLLFQINMLRPSGGRGTPLFEGHAFTAVVWDAAHNSAIALEKDRSLSGPWRLVRLDLIRQVRTEIAAIGTYSGHFAVSPSGSKAAYFRDGDTLEILALNDPAHPVDVPAAYGEILWWPGERRIVLKRGPGRRSGDLALLAPPEGALTPILHDLVFYDFGISRDGRWFGVTEPGKHVLHVYSLP